MEKEAKLPLLFPLLGVSVSLYDLIARGKRHGKWHPTSFPDQSKNQTQLHWYSLSSNRPHI
jgi:hypothetical protein